MPAARHPSELVVHYGRELFGEVWRAPLARATGANERTISRIASAAGKGEDYPAAADVLARLHRKLQDVERELRPYGTA